MKAVKLNSPQIDECYVMNWHVVISWFDVHTLFIS